MVSETYLPFLPVRWSFGVCIRWLRSLAGARTKGSKEACGKLLVRRRLFSFAPTGTFVPTWRRTYQHRKKTVGNRIIQYQGTKCLLSISIRP